ncbi:hypothetical protein C7377_0216 [Balneicella halophila]|uniref:HD domain-containing protein n=1 Tax=Balneicella halophila TaxID=1537566 RepID=A0A7L4UQA2_BALHA|nr:HD domain-containing protein [Balneicella halophila]PVX51923.1 hypothetical protein C7377_0216 [Balneicella halophila]
MSYKIISDPLYGLIDIETDIVRKIIDHPYFQRLRNIKQLALTYLVYPGAEHTRFQHALGCYHLARTAVKVLRKKDVPINKEEEEGVLLASLLHDIGHGPFSHTLEYHLVKCSHENFSLKIMEKINEELSGRLDTAIAIYKNTYHRKFLHQLVSSQADVDRLDYLKRDSFHTGVAEGAVGSERIIKMYDVVNDELVIDSKGIFSIEKFLLARRMMYWQVYLHKTVLSAEEMLLQIIARARYLLERGEVALFITEPLKYFLVNHVEEVTDEALEMFVRLDDSDIFCCVKEWCYADDFILQSLSQRLITRDLNKISVEIKEFSEEYIQKVNKLTEQTLDLQADEVDYFVYHHKIGTRSYHSMDTPIVFKNKNGELVNIAEVSTLLNDNQFNFTDVRYFISYPREIVNLL